MSKINKVNFDEAYLRSSSGHFFVYIYLILGNFIIIIMLGSWCINNRFHHYDDRWLENHPNAIYHFDTTPLNPVSGQLCISFPQQPVFLLPPQPVFLPFLAITPSSRKPLSQTNIDLTLISDKSFLDPIQGTKIPIPTFLHCFSFPCFRMIFSLTCCDLIWYSNCHFWYFPWHPLIWICTHILIAFALMDCKLIWYDYLHL